MPSESVASGKFANLKLFADGLIKQLGEDVASNKMDLERLQVEMRIKEDSLLELHTSKEKVQREYADLLSIKNDVSNRLEMALLEIENLKDSVKLLVVKIKELDDQSLIFSEKVIQHNVLFDPCLKLAQQEKDLVSKCAQQKFDRIHNQWASVISEKNALQLVNQELNNKVLELQKNQLFIMAQHTEECRLSEAKIRKLESEADTLNSKQTEMQALILKLEDNLRKSDEKMSRARPLISLLWRLGHDTNCFSWWLSFEYSELEKDSKRLMDGLKADILKRQEEIDLLQKVVEKSKENAQSLQKKITELENALVEKDQLFVELKAREKQVDDQKVMTSQAEFESKLQEAKKQYDHMLESKQLELSKRLREISWRNDQAINDMQRKYEVEKKDAVNLEKEKAEQMIQDVEKKYEKKFEDFKKESQQNLLRVQEEHAALNYSLSSGKRISKDVTTEVEEKDSPYPQETQTPVSNILKNVENGNNIHKHRKVTHHEYEIETSNGRTITKRKTRSTVMFGDPGKQRKRDTPKAKTPKASIQGVKGGVQPNPSNSDMFTEGSSNPYAYDPYAFVG